MKKQMLKQIFRRFRFTMVEMLTATGVLALIMYSLLALLDQSQRSMTIGMSKMDVYQDAKLALDMMQDDISSMDIEQMEIKLGKSNNKKVFQIREDGTGFTIYTTRYNVISEFCKVEYRFYEQTGTLEQTITKVKKVDSKYSDSEDKETVVILNNVYDFNVYTRNTGDDKTLKNDKKINDPKKYVLDDGYTCDRGIYLDLQLVDNQLMSAGKTYKNSKNVDDGFTSDVRSRVTKAMTKNDTNIAHRVHSFTRYVYMDLSYLNR